MNTIKQAKHLTDAILGKHGAFRLWRSGADSNSNYTWSAEIAVGGKIYTGRANTEEEARTELAKNYKNGEWEYDYSKGHGVRSDNSKLATSVQVGENLWWRVAQKPLSNNKLVERDSEKKIITINIHLPEPIKNILLMVECFKFANEKIEDESIRMSEKQIEEYVKRLYPIMSYSDLWNDNIQAEELNDFYNSNSLNNS